MIELGRVALVLTLGAALWAIGAAAFGGRAKTGVDLRKNAIRGAILKMMGS